MSRSSKNITKNNNLRTGSGRFVTKRLSGVFNSEPTASVVDSVLLYQLVFRSKKAALLAILLCLCFSTQSIKFAEANEDPSGPAEIKVETVPAVTTEVPEVLEIVAETPVVPEEDTTLVSSQVVDEPESTEPTSQTEQSQGTSSVSTESTDATATSTQVVNTDSASTSVATSSTQTEGGINENEESPEAASSTGSINEPEYSDGSTTDYSNYSASSQENIDDDEVEYEPPTLTNEDLVFTVESDTHFSFNKNECTRIEDGSFYCQKNDSVITLEDSLLSAPDSDGDLEIYLVRKGERYQITQNEVDDASPYYDELSNTIVWHRLLNDRYQIISYDIESGEEELLTQTNVNNMEPARHGEYTVWQRWVGNNWEVILYDGTTETQITNSARHDIAPHIRGPLVIWNSQSNDGSQELQTYDIQSRTHTTISDSEGVSVSNPRMVVMYEAMYENGDIVTKGFDLVSGKVVPLQSLPKQLPGELPNSEPTEEVRALIQSKPEPKSSSITQTSPANGDGDVSATATSSVTQTATSSAKTLDLRSLSTPELVKYLNEQNSASSTIPDLVIEPEIDESQASRDTASLESIPDVIIPAHTVSDNAASSSQTTQE